MIINVFTDSHIIANHIYYSIPYTIMVQPFWITIIFLLFDQNHGHSAQYKLFEFDYYLCLFIAHNVL